MGDFWKPTADMFSGLIEKPKMTQKLLSKPPFKYIFDIIIQTSKKTNFARGLYTGQQLNGDYYKDRDTKITFLEKIIKLTEIMGGVSIEAKPQKIVAGLEPENTNLMLQEIYKIASTGKNSDPYVKKVLGGGAQEQQQKPEKKQPEKKKIQRPPSAARLKKPQDQPISKKVVQQPEQPAVVQKQVPSKKTIEQKKPAPKKEEFSKKVQQLQRQAEEQAANQKKEVQQQQQPQESKNKLGNLRKKKKNDKAGGVQKLISTTGELNEKELQMLQSMIQTICQNTAPLGKSIEFINDDVEAMNKQLQFWRRQYNASKGKMQIQLKVSQESLLPVYDKIAEIQDQIKDQKAKIQNAKAQIIKNDSTIRDLLMSVVTTK